MLVATWVQYLAQRYFDVLTGAARDQTTFWLVDDLYELLVVVVAHLLSHKSQITVCVSLCLCSYTGYVWYHAQWMGLYVQLYVELCVWMSNYSLWNFINQRRMPYLCHLTFGVPLDPGTLHFTSYSPLQATDTHAPTPTYTPSFASIHNCLPAYITYVGP